MASAAGVSRAFLYKTATLSEEITRLRRLRSAPGQRLPAAQRSSDASKDANLLRLNADNRLLRAEIRESRAQNEALLGRMQEARFT